MQIFDPMACGNPDTTSSRQTMGCSHVEKYLNRNEQLNLNLEKKHLINCCLLLPKQVKSLIYLTGYGNLYR